MRRAGLIRRGSTSDEETLGDHVRRPFLFCCLRPRSFLPLDRELWRNGRGLGHGSVSGERMPLRPGKIRRTFEATGRTDRQLYLAHRCNHRYRTGRCRLRSKISHSPSTRSTASESTFPEIEFVEAGRTSRKSSSLLPPQVACAPPGVVAIDLSFSRLNFANISLSTARYRPGAEYLVVLKVSS